MFPQVSDRVNWRYPEDGLLQARGVVPEAEFRDPQDLDMHNVRSLLCVKHGRSTLGTFGRVNGLESKTRHYDENGVHQDAIEIVVAGYDVRSRQYRNFSDAGDSGPIVLGRDGRIIGLLTGGAGPTGKIDLSYITPYWWIEKELKDKFPECFLYDIVE